MRLTTAEAKTLRDFPFDVGVYQGRGVWADQQGQHGSYVAEVTILNTEDGALIHLISRVFLNEDGGVLFEEDSRIRFNPSAESQFEVLVRYEGTEYRGRGHRFGPRCHYEISMAEKARLEVNYTMQGESVHMLGSSLKNGNLTVWAETLLRNPRA
jgi:hypothetical protein